MLRMVDEINKTTFNGRAVVNCYSVPPRDDQSRPLCCRSTAGGRLDLDVGDAADRRSASQQLLPNVLGGADNLAEAGWAHAEGTLTSYAHIDQVHPERAPTTVTPIEIVAKGTGQADGDPAQHQRRCA